MSGWEWPAIAGCIFADLGIRKLVPLRSRPGQDVAMQLLGKRWLGKGTLVLAGIALLVAAGATGTVFYLAVAFHGQVDVIAAPLSHYVYVAGGIELVSIASVAFAVGALAVLVGMARTGVRMVGYPTVLFTGWAICLLVAAIFPTDPSPRVETLVGLVHQIAGAGIFALPCFAGLATAARLAERAEWRSLVGAVRALSVGSAALAMAYGVGRLDEVVVGMNDLYGGVEMGGILQRAKLTIDGATLAVLAVNLVRVAGHAVRTGA